jgi:hypothetical protein
MIMPRYSKPENWAKEKIVVPGCSARVEGMGSARDESWAS